MYPYAYFYPAPQPHTAKGPFRPYGNQPNNWFRPVSAPAYTSSPRHTEELIRNLATAINAEYNAIRAYERLAQLSPRADFRKIILDIRADEVGHFKHFSEIYAKLTDGDKPKLSAKPLPNDFLEGVEESIRDELEDSKFYQVTSLLTHDAYIDRVLLNAAADEARHATWFSYIWNSLR